MKLDRAARGRKEKGRRIKDHPTQAEDTSTNSEIPIFSLRHVNKDYCLSNCTSQEKASFADALLNFNRRTWAEIICTQKDGLGCEKISPKAIRSGRPSEFTDDVPILALRFCGKAPMVGYRVKAVFHVVWFDRQFTLYDHG